MITGNNKVKESNYGNLKKFITLEHEKPYARQAMLFLCLKHLAYPTTTENAAELVYKLKDIFPGIKITDRELKDISDEECKDSKEFKL